MVLCTYTTLNSQDHVQPKPIIVEKVTAAQRVENKPVEAFKKEDFVLDKKHIGIGKGMWQTFQNDLIYLCITKRIRYVLLRKEFTNFS